MFFEKRPAVGKPAKIKKPIVKKESFEEAPEIVMPMVEFEKEPKKPVVDKPSSDKSSSKKKNHSSSYDGPAIQQPPRSK